MTKQLRTEIERLWKRGEELKDQLIKMQKENARLREALSFYAEWGIDAPAVDAIIEHDRGDIARAALKEKE